MTIQATGHNYVIKSTKNDQNLLKFNRNTVRNFNRNYSKIRSKSDPKRFLFDPKRFLLGPKRCLLNPKSMVEEKVPGPPIPPKTLQIFS